MICKRGCWADRNTKTSLELFSGIVGSLAGKKALGGLRSTNGAGAMWWPMSLGGWRKKDGFLLQWGSFSRVHGPLGRQLILRKDRLSGQTYGRWSNWESVFSCPRCMTSCQLLPTCTAGSWVSERCVQVVVRRDLWNTSLLVLRSRSVSIPGGITRCWKPWPLLLRTTIKVKCLSHRRRGLC